MAKSEKPPRKQENSDDQGPRVTHTNPRRAFNYKLPAKAKNAEVRASVGGLPPLPNAPGGKPGAWQRQKLSAEKGAVKDSAPIVIKATPGVEIMNVYVRELK